MEEQPQQLSEFLQKIQAHIREGFYGTHQIIAEITNISGARHLYFDIVEKQHEQITAKCRAILWASNRTRVVSHFESMTSERLKAGMKVLFNVRVEFHEVWGFSLIIEEIDPSFSLGEFERLRLETIRKLEGDGLLKLNKALRLPRILQNLAVVTSETAAGYQDFRRHLLTNDFAYHFNLTLFPCLVQGEAAPTSIIAALDQVERSNKSFDAIILIRGGGSVIDLSCFDDYQLNFILSQSSYPVITGIGHDRDQSVADLVAHTSLKTPTAVAEFIIDRSMDFESALLDMADRIRELAIERLRIRNDLLLRSSHILERNLTRRIKGESDQLHQMTFDNARSAQKLINRQYQRLALGIQQINSSVKSRISREELGLERLKDRSELLNPLKVLERGFSISYVNGKVIKKQLAEKGQKLETRTAKQIITSTITETKNNG